MSCPCDGFCRNCYPDPDDKSVDHCTTEEIEDQIKWLNGLGKKCECGAEKRKTTHVDWCPKFLKENSK